MAAWLNPGQVEIGRRTFGQDDFDRFAVLSGDDNPIHVDAALSARTKFGRTVAHGMLLYSAVCGVLSSRLPGPDGVPVGQELMFPSPTYCDEEVTIRVEVISVSAADGLAELATTITRPDGSIGLDGRAWVQQVGAARPVPQQQTGPWPQGTEEPFRGMVVGQRAETIRAFSAADLTEYIALAGDAHPLWADVAYAGRLGWARRPVPGPLLGGLLSYLLGTRLPGRGTNYLKQRLHFPTPAYVDDVLTASVEIVRIRRDKQLINLATGCTNPNGEVVCQGEALVLVSDVSEDIRAGNPQRQG